MTLTPAQRLDGIDRTLIRQIFDSAPKDAVNLGLGQPDLPTPPGICLAGVRGIAQGWTAYTATAGAPQLREAIAKRYEGFAEGADGVVVTVGSQEGVFASLMAVLDPGTELLYPEPGYPAYPTMARLLGAVPVTYPVRWQNGFRMDAADIERRLSDRTRLVLVCSPSNPTGVVEEGDNLERLAKLLESRGVAWISDEIYSAYSYDAPAASLSRYSREGLVVSGLSKAWSMTGWRIGWVVGPKAFMTRINACHHYMVTCPPAPSQAAALEALGPAGEVACAEYLEIFRKRRALMAAELAKIPGIEFHMPQGAFYFYVKMPPQAGPTIEFCRRLLAERNVMIIPGPAFGSACEGYVRFSYAATDEAITYGVRAFGEVLAEVSAPTAR
jgi:aspartate/methionine/tyrosine aminotransferase